MVDIFPIVSINSSGTHSSEAMIFHGSFST